MKIQPPRKCDKCGEQFVPRSSRQHFCRKTIVNKCLICGDEFETVCCSDEKLVCSKPECKKYASHVSRPTEKICRNCGDKFITISIGQIYCNVEKEKECPSCGKLFKYLCNKDAPKTCGNIDCQTKLIMKTRTESVSKEVRTCKWCGKEFHPKEYRDVYCYDVHYKKCKICGKDFEIDVRKDQYVETCSKECMGKLMSQNHDYEKGVQTYQANMLEKYGVTNSFQLPQFREKAKQTSLAKYGTEWYTQTDEYKQRVKQTNLEKYGTEWYLGSEDSIEKRTETVRRAYRVDNVFQSDFVKEKMKQTNLNKYGTEFVSQSGEVRQTIVKNNLAKYGVEYPMMLPEFQAKARETNIKLFGRPAYTQRHIKNIEEWYKFMENPRNYISSHYDEKPTVEHIATDFKVFYGTVILYLDKHNAFDCVRRNRSKIEDEIIQYIHSVDKSIKVISCSKSIIPPKELDIYLPDYNFAIECNPTVTHNSSISDPWEGKPKSHTYHREKTNECDNKHIFLMHIFGYDWTWHKDIVLSVIRSKINHLENKVYARKCKIVELDEVTNKQFQLANNLETYINSTVRIGLKYKDKLVCLMTFTQLNLISNSWKLNIYCSLLNTSVIGGASKLFKYFVRKYNPNKLISYSNRSHTSGKLYARLGFTEIENTEPNYVWVNIQTDEIVDINSVDCIEQIGANATLDKGYVQIFDSGNTIWKWQSV